jgi:hypothetical protein
MHASPSRIVAALVLSTALVSCTPPKMAVRHTLFAGLERYDQAGLQAALTTPIVLPRNLRASLLWLDQATDGSASSVSEADRMRLLDDLSTALTAPPFASLSVIPTTLATDGRGELDLDAVRSAAAHLQSDVAILVLTSATTSTEWNPLAATYPALVTLLFVPGDNLLVDVGAQACAIDVRTGLLIACAQSHASDRNRLVVPAWKASSATALNGTVTEQAVMQLPQRLRTAVDARLSSDVRPIASHVAGIPYETP